ncbi:MAG: methyltransferase family protein [Halobacteriota archaeon]
MIETMFAAVQVSSSSSSLFPSAFTALVFSAVFILWVLSEVIGAGIMPRIRRGGRARTSRRERGSSLLIYAGIIVYFIVAFSFAGAGIAMLPSGVYYVGIIVMVLGIVIRQWAIAMLGRFFSQTLGVQEGHTVVETGPYRYVRHPSYTGALIFFVGFGLALQSWGAVLVFIPIFAVVYGYRMHVEEQLLIAQLGDAYVSYARRTKRLFPHVI